MSWKNILKMPVPIDVAENRDKGYKEQIIEFEKTVIEPALTKYIQGLRAGVGAKFVINLTDLNGNNTVNNNGYFQMSQTTVKELGGNREFIAELLADIYTAEGWTADVQKNTRKSPTGILVVITKS